MKKRILTVTMIMMMAVMSASCGSPDGKKVYFTSKSKTVSTLIEQNDASTSAEETEAVSVTSVEEEPKAPLESAPETDDVDLDLTTLSKTMVYSEVYNIMVNPDDYVGKTIRMSGDYYIYTDEVTGNKYYYCVIQDATACCAQGIEFVLTDDYKYPDDYPEEGTCVAVVGRFDTYMEGEYLYCTLRDAVLEN